MSGQGSPTTDHAPFFRRCSQFVFGLLLVTQCAFARGEDLNLRLQIAWGGKTARLWRGEISLPNGKLTDIRLLGIDADQAGSFVDEGNKILISPRFAHRYSGLEVSVDAAADEELTIFLFPDLDRSRRKELKIPLSKLRHEIGEQALGEEHLLRVARIAGDQIRVRLNRKTMVFEPGELLRLDVMGHHLEEKPGIQLRAKLRLRRADERRKDVTDFLNQGDDSLWSHGEAVRVDENGSTKPITNLEVPIPNEEGVYDLTIDLAHRLPQVGSATKRTVQLVVIDSSRPPKTGNGKPSLVTEFNPAESNRFERLTQIPFLPKQKGPWSNQPPARLQEQGKLWTQLQQAGWLAHPLPINSPGVPHLLHVEFPSGMVQDVSINILEPDASGKYSLAGINSGVTIGDPDLMLPGVSSPDEPTRHRLVFWPRTTSPIVLLSNRSPHGPVTFGRIRLEAFKQGLPTANPQIGSNRQRIAQLNGDLLKTMFFANIPLNDQNVEVDDWRSFYQAGSRLVDYLRYAGYDGASILVAGEGSTLYPSDSWNPTPRFDRGIFASRGQDPYRKDILELLLRIFEREGLKLIPAVELATPLPELEKQLSKVTGSDGIELVDASGRLGADLEHDTPGQAPYYNPLDSRVQNAIRKTVNELVLRYGKSEAFAGVDVRLCSNGFGHLPDIEWPFDSAPTGALRTFCDEQASNANDGDAIVIEKQLRLEVQKRQVSPLVNRWLAYRAEQLSDFYGRLAGVIQADNEANRLYVSMANLTGSAPFKRHLLPTLPRKTDSEKTTVESALLELGLDVHKLGETSGVVVLRPQRIAPVSQLNSQAINLELLEHDVQQFFVGKTHGAAQLFFEPQSTELDALQQPFQLATGSVESYFGSAGSKARHPYARSLAASDDLIVFDGGHNIAMGQEVSVKRFFDVFRTLPAIRFETAQLSGLEPLVVRQAATKYKSYAYVVNASPWEVETKLACYSAEPFEVAIHGMSDSAIRSANPAELNVVVEPYGLVAIEFSSPTAKLTECRQVTLPEGIARQLSIQLDEMVTRVDQIQQGRRSTSRLRDGGFETPLTAGPDGPWSVAHGASASVELDSKIRSEGNASLRLKQGDGGSISFTSNPFSASELGQLVVSMKLRGAKPGIAPLKITLETSNPDFQPQYRFTQQITTEFVEVPLRFPRLPNDSEMELKLRIEMVADGEIWIDDIRTYDSYHAWLIEKQPGALEKILFLAGAQHRTRDYANCYETLNGYWPRFLLRHVPPTQVATLPERPVIRRLPAPTPSVPSRFLDGMKRMMRRFR